jgi:hypothetical protein
MEPWSLTTVLITFAGGIMGAAFGGLFAFVICAFLVFAGCLVVLSGGSDFVLLQAGLGPIFGPHVGGFTSGVVAATYAAGVRKNHPGGAAKDILSPLMDSSWDVLLVGGLAALVSHAVLQVLGTIPFIKMFDCIALTVVLVPMAARLLFQKELPFGSAASIKEHGLLGTGNYAISWAPWNALPSRMVVLGLAGGLLSGGVAMGLKGILAPMVAKGTIPAVDAFVVPLLITWSIAGIMLIGLNLGTGTIQKFPIWHNIALMGALSYLRFDSLLIAGIVGILAAFLQELMARLFWNHGSNHIDPPAAMAAVGTLVINLILLAMGK